jgi:DNA-binding MarR family transcriptional regulator
MNKREAHALMRAEGEDLVEQATADVLALLVRMHSAATPLLCQMDITMAQVKTVLTVALAGQVTIGEIGKSLGIGLPAASTTVDKLVNLGWLERTEDPVDRRRARVRLTDSGNQQVETIWRVRRDLLTSWIEHLDHEELQGLAAGIAPLRKAAESQHESSTDAA